LTKEVDGFHKVHVTNHPLMDGGKTVPYTKYVVDLAELMLGDARVVNLFIESQMESKSMENAVEIFRRHPGKWYYKNEDVFITITGTITNKFSGTSFGLALYASLMGLATHGVYFEGSFDERGRLGSVGAMSNKAKSILGTAGNRLVWAGMARVQTRRPQAHVTGIDNTRYACISITSVAELPQALAALEAPNRALRIVG
jgi:hypothetical protein